MHKFMNENLRVNIWRDNFTSDYLRVNLPSSSIEKLIENTQEKDHVYLRHLSAECRSIISADMATNTQAIYRPTLGRYVGRDSVACRST